MSWNASAQGAARSTKPAKLHSRAGSKSIRGHISNPIPIPDGLAEERSVMPREASFSIPVAPAAIPVFAAEAHDSDAGPNVYRPDAAAAQSFPIHTPQRSKSTLRGAFNKLFGRRNSTRRRITALDEETTKQHGSDSTAGSRPVQNPGLERSDSLRLTEYNRALRSHSVSPEDVLTIQSVRHSINAEHNLTRRRAATTSTAHPASARWTKPTTALAPRPASTQDWGSRLVDATHDPEEIGRAITTGMKRRSRSLSLIPYIDATTATLVRRRSDEIRYWRESHNPDLVSPLSSSTPECDDLGALADDKHELKTDETPKTPLEPFPFGDIPYLTEIAGMNMKITDAASLESRIGIIENRLGRAEDLVTQLGNAVPDFRPQASHSDLSAPSVSLGSSAHQTTRPSTQSSAQHSGASRLSFGEARTFVGSIHQQSMMHHPAVAVVEQPVSTAIIPGASSLPARPIQLTRPFTMDHYATLLALMETDRSARLALEEQVRKLSHQIDLLTKHQSYAGTVRENGLPTGRSFGSFGEMSAFDFNDDDDVDHELGIKIGSKKHPRGSVAHEDSGIVTDGGDDGEDYPESFATPHEDNHGFSTLKENAGAAVDASAVTLSLSKLSVMGGMASPAI